VDEVGKALSIYNSRKVKKEKMRTIEYPFVWVMGVFLTAIEAVCNVLDQFGEYEKMRKRGFKLMKSENGEDFWVGYGD
jgi:hypothetical protein